MRRFLGAVRIAAVVFFTATAAGLVAAAVIKCRWDLLVMAAMYAVMGIGCVGCIDEIRDTPGSGEI